MSQKEFRIDFCPSPMKCVGRESNPGQLLEGSYARHYTTNAFGGCCLARTVKMLKLEAHESLIGLLELKRSFFETNPIESMYSVWIPSHTRKLCLSMLAK